MSDRPVAEASICTTNTQDFHAYGGIRVRNTNKRAVGEPRLRRRDHWNRLLCLIALTKSVKE